MKISRLFPMLAAIAALAGCATVVTGTDDMVTIDTDPSGAVCRLTADGREVAVVNPTPGSIEVPKSKEDLVVSCELEDHLASKGTIEADFQAMTLGNIILGGVIGVAVDAASGAMMNYEPRIRIIMVPETFPSEDERDDFFEMVEADLQRAHEETLVEIKDTCGQEANCERLRKKAERKRESALAELSSKKSQVRIVAPETEEEAAATG